MLCLTFEMPLRMLVGSPFTTINITVLLQKKPDTVAQLPSPKPLHLVYCIVHVSCVAISADTQATRAGFMDKLTFYYAYHGQ